MRLEQTAFIIAAVPFTLLAGLLLFFDAAQGGPQTGHAALFALCGGTFIYGSIYGLRRQPPLALFVTIGFMLNIIGAIVWLPAFSYPSGKSLGFIGAGLAAVWIKAIYSAYLEERH